MPNGYAPDAYVNGSPPTIVPAAAPPQYSHYTPLRYVPSVDVPVEYPDDMEYCPHSLPSPMPNMENVPPMAALRPNDASEQRPMKRKSDREHPDVFGKQPRQAISPISPGAQFASQGHARTYSEPQHGTQHNPVEILSSPEQTQSIPRKQMTGSAQSALPRDLRNAGLYVQAPDPFARKPAYYAVPVGKVPGIYTNYDDILEQIKGYSGSVQKKFPTEKGAWDFMERHRNQLEVALWKQRGAARESRNPRPARMAQRTPSPPPMYTYPLPTPPSDRSHGLASYGLSPSRAQQVPEHSEPAADSPRTNTTPNKDVPEPEIKLSAEQKRVVDLIVEGGKNVFYTGSAGCGKSTILKAFVPLLKRKGKKVRIVAPTNLAALNVGGQTTWNFAGWTPDSMKKSLDDLKKAAMGKEIWKKFDATDVLVIDEISMIENLQFERLNQVMKASRAGKATGPFGGVQIIVTGDFCQLSPVKPFKHCMGCGWELIKQVKGGSVQHRCENKSCRYDFWPATDKWAFRSKAWQECNFEHINLTEIHRQDDRKFISILQKIRRDGEIVKPHANILLNHTKDTEGAIQIFSKRDDVDRVNKQNIARLPSQQLIFKCLDDFKWNDFEDKTLEKYTEKEGDTLKQLRDHRYEAVVHLKEGMRVLLQANLEPDAGLVNGSQGLIIGFEPFNPDRLPRAAESKDEPGDLRGTHAKYAERQIKEYANQNRRQPWPVVRFDNGLTRTIYADCPCNELGNVGENGDESKLSLLSRAQIPLVAGYAITVHKSQGMTLDRVIVDLREAFEASQLYVALSRARSLKGLEVVALPRRHLGGANPQVKEFFYTYLNPNSPCSLSQMPQASQASQSSQS
ncbi:ATP-dependent DNA helicase PIF1 [Alternaria panax]|uniref:ATP-dependent DNA helicase n=1 Tax=Alternaria panax TaxID=48097 RepID=A0AAD4I840_9PLEO|nr:ATP-dependent DNA helicase PIF1 [Alternaria panax]